MSWEETKDGANYIVPKDQADEAIRLLRETIDEDSGLAVAEPIRAFLARLKKEGV